MRGHWFECRVPSEFLYILFLDISSFSCVVWWHMVGGCVREWIRRTTTDHRMNDVWTLKDILAGAAWWL